MKTIAFFIGRFIELMRAPVMTSKYCIGTRQQWHFLILAAWQLKGIKGIKLLEGMSVIGAEA